jgi:TetR/AcrR family transcriptional regulator, repressor for uid operon
LVAGSEIAEERKRQILEAAAACFARHGFHGATMPQICAEAGLSPGTVYRYFRSKDDLIEAMVELDRAESLALIATIERAADPPAAVGKAVDAALAGIDDPAAAAVYLEVGAEAARNPRVAAIVRRHQESITDALAALIRRGQERGNVAAAVDPHDAAVVIFALIDGVVTRKALAPETDLDRYAPIVKRLIASLLQPQTADSPQTIAR